MFEREPINCDNPYLWGLWKGYQIYISRNYDLKKVKELCMDLEIDSNGDRCCDIDIYLNSMNKVSRTDLGYKKER